MSERVRMTITVIPEGVEDDPPIYTNTIVLLKENWEEYQENWPVYLYIIECLVTYLVERAGRRGTWRGHTDEWDSRTQATTYPSPT